MEATYHQKSKTCCFSLDSLIVGCLLGIKYRSFLSLFMAKGPCGRYPSTNVVNMWTRHSLLYVSSLDKFNGDNKRVLASIYFAWIIPICRRRLVIVSSQTCLIKCYFVEDSSFAYTEPRTRN